MSSSSTNCVFLWGVRGWGLLMQLEVLEGGSGPGAGAGRGNESYCDARLSRGGGRRCGLTVRIIDNSKNINDDDDMLVSCWSQLL